MNLNLAMRLNKFKQLEVLPKTNFLISQFEDELVKIWNKPKFAKNSNYVITLDKLPEKIIDMIIDHKKFKVSNRRMGCLRIYP